MSEFNLHPEIWGPLEENPANPGNFPTHYQIGNIGWQPDPELLADMTQLLSDAQSSEEGELNG